MAAFANRVKIESVILSTETMIKPLDITGLTQDIIIYENINMPYLTGRIAIFDDHELFSKANLNGTERIEFTFRQFQSGYFTSKASAVSKTFIISTIDSEKNNDNTALLVCELIEDHGYVDGLINFSKSYTGTGEEIIQKILSDKLQKSLYPIKFKPSVQPFFRYIVPYMSPLQAASMITKKMTTEDGFPYFLYSSLFQDQLVLNDLETILSSTPFNSQPLSFSQGGNVSNNPADQLFNLDTFKSTINEDTLSMAQLGALKSGFSHISATTLQEFKTLLVVPDEVAKAGNKLPKSEDHEQLVNRNFIPKNDDQSILTYTSNQFTSLEMETYSNVNNYSQSSSLEQSKLKAIRMGTLAFLAKNSYIMSGPGMIFTTGEPTTTVGNLVNIHIQKNYLMPPKGLGSNIDEKRSGNFVMMSRKYSFDVGAETCSYTMECSRIFNNKRIL